MAVNALFVNLRIRRIVVHQIFERNETRGIVSPVYNSTLTRLNPGGLAVLQERIINALGIDSHSMEMEIANCETDSVFRVCTDMIYLSDDREYIEKSKRLAYKLAEAQTSRKIPGGVVVIFDGTIGAENKRCIGIIKAEIHEGFTLDLESAHLVLKHIEKLLLTPQQKLYKIGFFVAKEQNAEQNRDHTREEYCAVIYDHNLNKSDTSGAAVYFYSTFLGCAIINNNKTLTRDFYMNTREYIQSLDISEEDKVDLNTALYSYLKLNTSNVIQTSIFAVEYLKPEMRDGYNDFMETKNFPSNSIAKDTELINEKLRRRKMRFSSNVTISAPSDNFSALVEIVSYEENKTTLRIEGRIQEQ